MPVWTAPRTWVVGEIVTAALMNTHVRDNFLNAHYEYGTSLPGSPSDGQLAVLVDSTTAPTYRWTFRFNNSIAANKWEFIGGTAMAIAAPDMNHANITSYRFTATLGTVPRTGIYDTVIHSRLTSGGVNVPLYTIGVNAAADDTYAGSADGYTGLNHLQRRTLAAGDALSLAYRVTVGSISCFTTNTELLLTPVQVA